MFQSPVVTVRGRAKVKVMATVMVKWNSRSMKSRNRNAPIFSADAARWKRNALDQTN